jgi:hypothetical protein
LDNGLGAGVSAGGVARARAPRCRNIRGELNEKDKAGQQEEKNQSIRGRKRKSKPPAISSPTLY